MLITQRLEKIVNIVNEKQSIDTLYLCQKLNASEATIRRDLTNLHKQKKIVKVRGGAKCLDDHLITKDTSISSRKNEHVNEKIKIAKYCASIIEENDYVYIDSGSTTEMLAQYINTSGVSFVTNSVSIALTLTRKGIETYIIGGKLKRSTESIIGTSALVELDKFNFSIGFFGTNGISKEGLTTPDSEEADIKKKAMMMCEKKYVLADSSKFDKLSLVKFSNFNDCIIITNETINEYKNYENIVCLDKINEKR